MSYPGFHLGLRESPTGKLVPPGNIFAPSLDEKSWRRHRLRAPQVLPYTSKTLRLCDKTLN